MITLK